MDVPRLLLKEQISVTIALAHNKRQSLHPQHSAICQRNITKGITPELNRPQTNGIITPLCMVVSISLLQRLSYQRMAWKYVYLYILPNDPEHLLKLLHGSRSSIRSS